MSSSWKNPDEEEEEEEDLDETEYTSQKDAVLFAIDVSSTMLAPPRPSDDKKAEKDSPTLAAIKCAYQIMQQRIISSPKDMMGVLLFGTEMTKFQEDDGNSRGSLSYPHCYLLCDLMVPSVAEVKELKRIAAPKDPKDDAYDEEDVKAVEELLQPTEEPVSMSNMLFCANQIFTTRAPNFGSRRLFIITDKDDPHSDDKTLRSQATVRAKDLYDLGVVIELFPISHPDHEFDRSKFYDDVIYRDAAEGTDLAIGPTAFQSQRNDGISLLTALISDINSKQTAKRSLFSHLPFEIAPNLKITVKGYNIVQKQKPERKGWAYENSETTQMVFHETEKYSEGQAVAKTDIKKAYKFGGSQVVFSPDELKKIKNFGPPVLRVLGFKPQSMLKIWHSVKKATFIYPSEEDYIGSTRVFAALWKKLVKSKLMGLAWFIARSNSSPLLVAILPSEEELDESGIQKVPAGLWLYPLPFADDVREIPTYSKPLVASDELTEKMRVVVQQLQLPKSVYDHTKYPNPSLQWHYRILQAMALLEDCPEHPDDKTMPKYKQIQKRAGPYIQEWQTKLDEEVLAFQKERYGGIGGTDLKRNSDGDDDGPPKKKIKAEKSDDALADMDVASLKKMVTSGALKKYVLPDLKAWCKGKGLSNVGKKQELIDRIEQWVEEH